MKLAHKFLSIILLAGIFPNAGLAQEQIGVASAVNKNTTDLTLEQERKLIDAVMKSFKITPLKPMALVERKCYYLMAQHFQ